jgi:4-hydroxybenzoate polyprenyltransferase
VALLVGYLANPVVVFIFLTPLVVGTIYSIRIASFRIKDVLAVKNLSVAFSFALSSAFLPYVFEPNLTLALLIFAFLLGKVFINTVVFDVRDVEGDRRAGASTIPAVFGVHATKLILLAVNSALLVWLGWAWLIGAFLPYLPVLLFSIMYGYGYIFLFCRSQGAQKRRSYDFLVDGEFIVVAACAVLVYLLVV